jgi:hypothetical protein
MGDSEDVKRTQTKLQGGTLPGANVGVTGGTLKLTSQTQATFPTPQTRTTVGVGEFVDLTVTGGATGTATWAASPNVGTFTGASGNMVTYTAPDRAANPVTITATDGGSATIKLTVVEPSDVVMSRTPQTKGNHTVNTVSVGVVIDVTILPATVSFENIAVSEVDVNAVGTGCAQSFFAQNPTGHGANLSPTGVDRPTSNTSGSKMTGPDLADGDFSMKCNGGWSWTIPWQFQVGTGGTPKTFATVVQSIAITAAGQATITKKSTKQSTGATNTSAFASATDIDPAFGGSSTSSGSGSGSGTP